MRISFSKVSFFNQLLSSWKRRLIVSLDSNNEIFSRKVDKLPRSFSSRNKFLSDSLRFVRAFNIIVLRADSQSLSWEDFQIKFFANVTKIFSFESKNRRD